MREAVATSPERGERKKGFTGRLREIKNEAQRAYREVKDAADEAQSAYRETVDQVEAAREESRPHGPRESADTTDMTEKRGA